MQDFLQILTIVLSGASVASIVIVLYNLRMDSTFKKRLAQIFRQGGSSVEKSTPKPVSTYKVERVIDILSRLSLPEEGWQSYSIKIRFMQAGIRNKNAPQFYYAIKTVLTLLLPVALALLTRFIRPDFTITYILLVALVSAAVGYYMPEMLLHYITQKRIERLRKSLPDMMDLLVVATESGMSIDAAISRISREMARTSPDLAEEFYLAFLEMNAGATRIEAFRNLALRTRLEELEDLVVVLVQSDKFGTSLADSLRVEADMMRSRRFQRAEELALKVPVKLTLPLVFCIFPAILIVLIAPALMRIFQQMSGQSP
ncbi:MAG: type II secretion system F family protein [Chlorobaculum sp.]|jgi:tight adherence protein C|nr:type II secretion system F family protein [Chlorobaculum sp.]